MDSTTTVEIRPATNNDASSILKCLAEAFAPYRELYSPSAFADTVLNGETIHIRLQQMHVLVATAAGNVVGTIAGIRHADEGHLRGMAVLPRRHGSGIALKLLTAIETYLRSQGCKRITLDTTFPLEPAMRFYEKNGYQRSGNIQDFFGMPLIEYVKVL
jgi:ribosomal protein S18 acetylase RimI-like enzyme